MLSIVLTREALIQGYWFATPEYCKEWEKYSVVEHKSKNILLTSSVKYNAEKFVNYMNGKEPTPKFYSNKVTNYWRSSR